MSYCKKHNRYSCYDSACTGDNAGDLSVGINDGGDLMMGIGGGLAIDLSDGSLGMEIAPGISIDFDGS